MHEPSHNKSSGVLVSLVVAFLVVAVLGLIAVAGVGFVLLNARQAMVAERQALLAAREAEVREARARAAANSPQLVTAVSESPSRPVIIHVDSDGNISVAGEAKSLDQLQAHLEEGMGEVSVEIRASHDCRMSHVVAIMDLCNKTGTSDYVVTAVAD